MASSRIFLLAAVPLLGGCGEPLSGGGAGQGGAGGSDVGCADGEREAFVDMSQWPDVAGCSGGFDHPGVAAGEGLARTCGGMAGDDAQDPSGKGCSAVDLCADGWHVCGSAAELAMASGGRGCDPAAQGFYATRQAQQNDSCQGPPAVDNLVGCGTLGGNAPPDRCAPLERVLRREDCDSTQTWHCGTESNQAEEARLVTKGGPGEGGVICCRDPS